MAKYHYIGGDNKEYGPYSLKTMRTYRSQNRMNKKSMVKKDGGKFQPAANFEELAPAKKKPPSTNYNLKDYSSFVDPLSVRKLAVKIVTSIDKKYSQPWHQAAAIFDYVKKNIRYVRDPRGIDYVAPPSETIECGGGDCDDHAVLISSLCEAVGIPTRLVYCRGPEENHLLCQVRFSREGIGASLGAYYGWPKTSHLKNSINVDDGFYWDSDPKDAAAKWIFADTSMCRYFGDIQPLARKGYVSMSEKYKWKWLKPIDVFKGLA